MKEQFIELYEELVMPFTDGKSDFEIRKAKDDKDFNAMTCVPCFIGKDFGNGNTNIMLVGRAVNGWDAEWCGTYKDIAKQALNISFDMERTNGIDFYGENSEESYNYNQCAFMQLGRKVAVLLGINENDIANHLLWTNLYKVAPALSGNPNGKVQKMQRNTAIKLLKKEIDIYKPSHIIFVTDMDWMTTTWRNSKKEMSFYEALTGINDKPKGHNGYVKESGTYNSIPYVICVRPETRKRDEIAYAIISAFENLKENN